VQRLSGSGRQTLGLCDARLLLESVQACAQRIDPRHGLMQCGNLALLRSYLPL